MDKIIIYMLDITLIKNNINFVSSFVDDERKKKANRYVNEGDRLLSFGAGFLLRKYLPNGEIKIKEDGKPYLLNGPFFNISHSKEYVVLAVHPNREVGIDIEKIDENKIDGIQYVLNKEEKIHDIPTLFKLWSNKESLIKCLSSGLKDIKNVSGLPLEGLRSFEGKKYFTKSLIYDGYSLSVTAEGEEPFNLDIKQISSLEAA